MKAWNTWTWVGLFMLILGLILLIIGVIWALAYKTDKTTANPNGKVSGWAWALIIIGVIMFLIGLVLMLWALF